MTAFTQFSREDFHIYIDVEAADKHSFRALCERAIDEFLRVREEQGYTNNRELDLHTILEWYLINYPYVFKTECFTITAGVKRQKEQE